MSPKFGVRCILFAASVLLAATTDDDVERSLAAMLRVAVRGRVIK
jgi:hypothetical protein